ncbi:MAG TPA: hypothetical protein EYP98_14710 [Planctomycetes bacterium]|nr:hypothetical protein [Planctomycetota bacterium]
MALPLIAGNWYGVLGAGNATVGSATSQNPYSNQGGTFVSSILTIPTNIERLLTQSGIGANGGNQPCSSENGGTISRVDVYISSGGGAAIASAVSQGDGCTSAYGTFYETMATAAFDLTDTDITGTNTGAGYVVLTNPGTGPLPVGGVDPLGGTVLVLPDDGQVVAGTLGMSVGSNGWMALGAGNSNGFAPTGAVMLGNPSEAVYTWTDLQPNTSGITTYEEDVATGQCRVTFDGVVGWNTPDPCFIQIDMNVNTGDWAIRYGVVGFANPEQWLVGYSPAGVSADPGPVDISAAAVILTEAIDIEPLTLTGIGRPVMGAAAVAYDVTTSNIEAGAVFHIGFLGLARPGLPLAAAGFGPGDCFLNASLDVIVDVTALPAGPLTWTTLILPIFDPALNGFVFNAQAATFDLGVLNANGRTSNGLKMTLGDL